MSQKGIDNQAKKLFFTTISSLKHQVEFEEFFSDLFSSSEVKDVSRRLLAAKLLLEKETFMDINFKMGMSAGTINKIHFKTKGSPLLNNLFSK